MKLYLNVPFAEKENAKALGARWNQALKLWYVEIKDAINPALYQWFIQDSAYHLLAEYYTIVVADKSCWKCHEQISVSTFLLDDYYELSQYEDDALGLSFLNWESVHNQSFVSNITLLDQSALAEIVKENPHYRKTYSKTLNGAYFANNCPHCHMLQGDFNLYQEPGAVFYDCRDQRQFRVIKKIEATFKAEGNTAITAGSATGIMIKVVGH